MNSAADYLGIAGLLAMRSLATTRGLPRTRGEFAQEFEDRYGWRIDSDQIQKALEKISAWGFVSILTDRYAGESLRFSKLSTDDTVSRYIPESVSDLLGKGRQGGVPWFNDVFKNQQFWDDLHIEKVDPAPFVEAVADEGSSIEPDLIVPASDRIVTLSDNRPTVDLLSADLRGISEEIRGSNEVTVELGDEKDLLVGEIASAETLISQPSFRLQRLYVLILPALRFLAEKFATGAIGEMAKRIIALLLGMA